MMKTKQDYIEKVYAIRMFDIRVLDVQVDKYFQWSINFQAFRNDEGFGWAKKTDIITGKISIDFKYLILKKLLGVPLIKFQFKTEYGQTVTAKINDVVIPEEFCLFYKKFLDYSDSIPLSSITYYLSMVLKELEQAKSLKLSKFHNKIFHYSNVRKNIVPDDFDFCIADFCELCLMSSLDIVPVKDWRGKVGPKLFSYDFMQMDSHWLFKYVLFDGVDLWDDVPVVNPVTGNMTSYRYLDQQICVPAERIVYMIYGSEIITMCFLNENNETSFFYLRHKPDLLTIVHRDSFEGISI